MFEFEVPLAAIPFRKPIGEAGLLFRRKRLNRVLDLGQVYIRILPRRRGMRAALRPNAGQLTLPPATPVAVNGASRDSAC